MLIIIEGPDGAGKTTLAESLSEMLNARIVHFGTDKESKTLINKYTEIMLSSQNENLIIDRLWISEMIYSKVMREGNCRLTQVEINILSYIFYEMRGRLILCLPDYDICLANYLRNIENEYISNQTLYTQVYLEYFKATVNQEKYLPGRFSKLNNVYTYNYTEESASSLCIRMQI
jgi:thymidylate kinase